MTDRKGQIPDAWVDDLMAQAATHAAAPSDDLMARVLADAEAQSEIATLQRAPLPRRSFWAVLGDAIGGWPALGGLTAAGIAGLWVGLAPPAGLETMAADYLGGTEAIDLIGDGFDDLFEEATDG